MSHLHSISQVLDSGQINKSSVIERIHQKVACMELLVEWSFCNYCVFVLTQSLMFFLFGIIIIKVGALRKMSAAAKYNQSKRLLTYL